MVARLQFLISQCKRFCRVLFIKLRILERRLRLFLCLQIRKEDEKVLNVLLTFDFLTKIAALPRSYQTNQHTSVSIQAFLNALRNIPVTPMASAAQTAPATTNTNSKFIYPSFASMSTSNICSKASSASCAIARTNSTTLPAAPAAQGTQQDLIHVRDQQARFRSGTLGGKKLSGLSNRRSYSSLDDCMDITGATARTHVGSSKGGGITGNYLGDCHDVHYLDMKTSYAKGMGAYSSSSARAKSRNSSGNSMDNGRLSQQKVPSSDEDRRIQSIAFKPDIASFLKYCSQAEVLFSTLTQGNAPFHLWNSLHFNMGAI